MSRTIHQFHYWTSPGDAITNQMHFLRSALIAAGHRSEIFAVVRKGGLPDVKQWHEKAVHGADLCLIHHSQGTPNLDRLLQIPTRKGLVYHNITPPHFFQHDPTIASLCHLGRTQLKALVRECEVLFADSNYNARELKDLGARDVSLLPLFDLKDDNTSWSRAAQKGLQLLFVGRLCPHKDQARLIEVAHHLVPMGFDVQLNLVGRGDPLYTLYLKELIRFLDLDKRVKIHGSVTDERLREFYRGAKAFVCVSRHEGFCIPVVEAMKFSVPIFSTTDAALGETLGKAGVHLLNRDPVAIAKVLAAALPDDPIEMKILESQKRRFKEIQGFQNSSTAVTTIEDQL